MSELQLIQSLEVQKSNQARIGANRNGPILPVFSISYQNLPLHKKVKDLMKEIMRSGSALDKGKKTSIGDDTMGAMRQIHTNDPHYLPRINIPETLSGRSKSVNDYVVANKHHSSDRGGGSTPTGYVEYTAADNSIYSWGGNRMRIIFDYINSKIYFSPFHYASWSISQESLTIIDKPAFGSGHPNPFYWIIEV